jgi:hypothetical protein
MTRRQLFVRTTLTAALPFVLVWSFIAEFWRIFRTACWYGWMEATYNFDSYREFMAREDYEE